MRRSLAVLGIIAIVMVAIALFSCAGTNGTVTIDQARNAAAAGVHTSIRLYDVLLKLAGAADRAGMLQADQKVKILDAAEKFRGPAKLALNVIKSGGDPTQHLNSMQAAVTLIEGIVSSLNLSAPTKSAWLHDTDIHRVRDVSQIVNEDPRSYFGQQLVPGYAPMSAMAVPAALILALLNFATKYGPAAVEEIKTLLKEHGVPTPDELTEDEAILAKKPEDIMSGDGEAPPAGGNSGGDTTK